MDKTGAKLDRISHSCLVTREDLSILWMGYAFQCELPFVGLNNKLINNIFFNKTLKDTIGSRVPEETFNSAIQENKWRFSSTASYK